jgi:hypothetical protein
LGLRAGQRVRVREEERERLPPSPRSGILILSLVTLLSERIFLYKSFLAVIWSFFFCFWYEYFGREKVTLVVLRLWRWELWNGSTGVDVVGILRDCPSEMIVCIRAYVPRDCGGQFR